MWETIESIKLARELEAIAIEHRYHVALGGGVLVRGFSDKDCDIFLYVHTTFDEGSNFKFNDPNKLIDELLNLGGWVYLPPEESKKDKGSGDPLKVGSALYKVVKRMTWYGKRVDLIFLLPQ